MVDTSDASGRAEWVQFYGRSTRHTYYFSSIADELTASTWGLATLARFAWFQMFRMKRVVKAIRPWQRDSWGIVLLSDRRRSYKRTLLL